MPSSAPPRFDAEESPTARRGRVELELRQYDPLVRREVGRMLARLPPNVLADDLYSAGRVGLWQTLLRTPDRNMYYLQKRIKGAMLDELRAQDWLKRRARATMHDAMVVGMADVNNWGMVEPKTEPQVEAAEARRMLEQCIARLEDPRDQFVLRAIYLEEAPMKTVAVRMGVTAPRVSQLRDRAVIRLRKIVLAVEEIDTAPSEKKR